MKVFPGEVSITKFLVKGFNIILGVRFLDMFWKLRFELRIVNVKEGTFITSWTSVGRRIVQATLLVVVIVVVDELILSFENGSIGGVER
jgi:hypothetical protein